MIKLLEWSILGALVALLLLVAGQQVPMGRVLLVALGGAVIGLGIGLAARLLRRPRP